MYRKKAKGWLKHLDFFILDVACLEFALIAAFLLNQKLRGAILYLPVYKLLALLLFMIQCLVIMIDGCYDNILKRRFWSEAIVLFKETFLIVMVFAMFCYITKRSEYFSRGVLGLTAVIYGNSGLALRTLRKRYLNRKKTDPKNHVTMLIVGEKVQLAETIRKIQNVNFERVNLCGIVVTDEDLTGTLMQGIPVVANADNLAAYVAENWVDEVFIDYLNSAEENEAFLNDLYSTGVTVHRSLAVFGNMRGKKQSLEKVGPFSVLTTSLNILTTGQVVAKRLLDIAGGIVGFLLMLLLLLFVAPAIWIKDPGPVFFSQVRIGKNGKPFKIYKFRSMYMNAEEMKEKIKAEYGDGKMMFKLENDPRIIGFDPNRPGKGFGNFIRKYSIDEFPQFINVLKGDMSLVGFRPPTVDEWQQYELHHHARITIKPGITGMWQVSGRSELTDFEKVVEIDTGYIENWSIWLDLKILLKTVAVVLSGKGAV